MKDFKKCLDDFLNNKTYTMSYRSNYDSAREFNNELISYIKDLQKYKSLYENEKEHTDTLKRIIKKIEEYIEENTEFKKSTFYGLPDYYVFKGDIENVLNLLKEIK